VTLSEWRGFAITQEVMAELKRRQTEAKEALAYNAGINPRMDAWRSGAIAAYEDMLNIQLDEETS
jgi:hypothetical protein